MVAISDPKRKSGISILGDAPWGTHFCQFYQTKQDLIEILVPYFKTGLENNEFCMWVTSEPLTVEEARAELQRAVKDLDQYNKKGQIEILDFSQWYTRTGKFDADKVVRGWVDKEQQARKNGFEGLRLAGNTFWIEHKDWKSFSDYEATINTVIHNYHMLAICPYSLDKCDANDILDVFSTHQFALINRNGKWAIIESTERKQVEEALRDSERQYRTLFESANDAILIFEPENEIILEANQKACETYGFAKKELVGMSLKKLTLDVARGDQQVAELLQTGTYRNFETVHLRADGTPIDFLASSSVIDYRGQRAILSVMRDVTERKQAQKAVQESEQCLRTIVEASLDAIVAVNAEGRIVLFNDAAQDLFQYSKEDALRQPAKILLREETGQIHQERLERFLNAGVGRCGHIGRRMEKVFRRKDGSLFEGEVSMSGGRLDGLRLVVLAVHDITERKRAEEQIQSLSRFPAENPNPILRLQRDGTLIYANPGARPLLQLWGGEVGQRVPADWARLVADSLASGAGKEVEVACDQRVYSFILAPIQTAGYVNAYGRDITERKRAEEALRESEERWRSLTEYSPDHIMLLDLDSTILFINRTVPDLTKGEVIGTSYLKYVPPEYHQIALDCYKRVLANRRSESYSVAYKTKEGEVRYFHVRVGPICKNGQVVAFISTSTDITERKRAEEALHESEERYRSLVEAAPDVIYTVSAEDGSLTSLNPAFETLTGWSRAEWLGKPLVGIVHPDDLPVAVETLQKASRGETQPPYELRVLSKSGKYLVGEFTSTPHVKDGKVVGELGIARDITERKRTEERLRWAKEEWERTFDAVPDLIALLDEDYRIVRVNRALAERLGLQAGECVGLTCYKAIHGMDKPPDICPYMNGLLDGKEHVAELALERLGGDFLVTHSPLRDVSGRPVGSAIVARDITARKQAEEALRESEDRYRDLVEHSEDLICTHDLEGRILSLNEPPAKVLGYTRSEILGMKLQDILAPEVRHECDEYLARIQRVGAAQGLMLVQSKSGDKRLWEYHNTLRTEGVATPIVRGLAHDITERKRAEEALRESQGMFQKAFHASPDTMVLHSLSEGRHMDVNESFLRLVGYRREELVGRTAMDLGLWWDLAQGDEYLRILREQGRVRDLEICVRTKSGEACTLLLSAEVIEIAGQDCVVAIGKDISHRKLAEQERLHLEEQLRQAQKMEAVGRLAGGVAHDFNNILMVINGYVQLVLRKLSPRHPLRQNLNEIRKAGERAASLTGQLLAFSRRQILVPRILDLNKVVADTKEMLRRVIGEDVELVIRQGHKLAKVLADPGQIAQVLVNLAVNARDAMPGGGRLTIETGNVDLREAETGDLPGAAPGPYVTLAVSDTGVGMSKEVMEHMFEPFFTTRERGKGTGLGLSMVYGVVKQSGGYVRVQSEPGQGSAFRIYLPCARVGSGEPAARSTKARLAKGRETILVVEDELAVRQVVAATLRSSGYKVLEAGSGEEAMRRLRRHDGPLHLVLSDLVMPRMNGRKVADSVRTLYPEVKVVFMSGYTDDALLRHGVSDTQGSFLQKPFTMETLTQEVREVLKPSQ
jgi:two-component system cell cycle sensor histidine kinase/response regulator CckA